jgi:N-acetylneuraminic acid mutarotase
MSAPVELVDPTPLGGAPREPSDPLRYELTITNELGTSEGKYYGLVAVEDSFVPGQNTHPFLIGQDGAYRVPPQYSPLSALFQIDKFVTYQVFEYEIQPAMQFTQKALMPTPRWYARAAVVGDLIYVIGGIIVDPPGDTPTSAIEAYDPQANTWNTSLTPMLTARSGMAVAAVGQNIYVIGGQLGSPNGNTTVMEIYDTISNSWSTGNPIPDPRRHGLDATVKDTIIYVAGGYNTQSKDQRTLYRYDTVNGGWGRLSDMVAVRSQFAMTIKGDNIYVVGGQPVTGSGSNLTPYIEVFDTVNTTWSQPNSLPKLDTPVLGPRWENVNGDIVLVGGAINATTLEHRVLLYDEVAEEFVEIGQLLIPRTSFASATWNGRIYLFGGLALSPDIPPVPFLTSSTEEGVR